MNWTQIIKYAFYMSIEVEVGVIYAVCAILAPARQDMTLNYYPKSCNEILLYAFDPRILKLKGIRYLSFLEAGYVCGAIIQSATRS